MLGVGSRTRITMTVAALWLLAAQVLFSVMLAGCLDDGEDVTPGTGKGTLRFVGVQYNGTGSREINHSCTGVDVRFLIGKMQVSSGAVVNGSADTMNWTTIYTGNVERRVSEMNFSAELPVGNYNNLRFEWRNWFQWVFQHDGTEIVVNESHFAPTNVFFDPAAQPEFFYATVNNENGSWRYVDNNSTFELMNANEKVGGLEIRDGKVTTVKWQFNVQALTWTDSDENGFNSPGDHIGNYSSTFQSANMFDFIVTNES